MPKDVPLGVRLKPNELWKRSMFGAICLFVESLAAASSTGENPLQQCTEDKEGAFVAFNRTKELISFFKSYLAGVALARLHAGVNYLNPDAGGVPVEEYRRKKDVKTTPTRCELEELWTWDPHSENYCVVYALTEGLKAYFGFTLSREQSRAIFENSDERPLGLRAINMYELRTALLPQLPDCDGRLDLLCDKLLVPFKEVFDTDRNLHRAHLSLINNTPVDWAARLAPFGLPPFGATKAQARRFLTQAKAERKALILAQLAAGMAARGGNDDDDDDDEDEPSPSRSGRRKRSDEDESPERGSWVAKAGRTRSIGAQAPASDDDSSSESSYDDRWWTSDGDDDDDDDDSSEDESDVAAQPDIAAQMGKLNV